MTAYYNEIDPYCCKVLRARIADGSLPPGDVDDRDIREVSADDCRGYDQIHLFAGIGGFGYAARLAGVSDGFGILTGGFPCQPWSVAGRRGGASDDRHLWPEMLRLIREVRPQRVLGENVPGLDDAEYMALDGVLSDLEGAGYEGWPIEVPACGVDAPHVRARLWIMAVPDSERGATVRGECADAAVEGVIGRARGERGAGNAERQESDGGAGEDTCDKRFGGRMGRWADEPCIQRVADGIPKRLDRNRALGNAIVPQVAAQIMQAMAEATP